MACLQGPGRRLRGGRKSGTCTGHAQLAADTTDTAILHNQTHVEGEVPLARTAQLGHVPTPGPAEPGRELLPTSVSLLAPPFLLSATCLDPSRLPPTGQWPTLGSGRAELAHGQRPPKWEQVDGKGRKADWRGVK